MSGRSPRRRFYDLEVDARELEDPYHDPRLRGHVGTHDETLERMTGLAKWRSVLHGIAARLSGRQNDLLWNFFARAGVIAPLPLQRSFRKLLIAGVMVNVENVEEQVGVGIGFAEIVLCAWTEEPPS